MCRNGQIRKRETIAVKVAKYFDFFSYYSINLPSQSNRYCNLITGYAGNFVIHLINFFPGTVYLHSSLLYHYIVPHVYLWNQFRYYIGNDNDSLYNNDYKLYILSLLYFY